MNRFIFCPKNDRIFRNPLKKLTLAICLLLCVSLCSCTTLISFQEKETSPGRCIPFFPDKDGWYGGDGAYSIPLDEKRTLWLFGDTFAACGKFEDRVGMDVVLGTTVGISTCSNDGFRIHYYLKHKGATFVSSFGENEWLWPQDPFMVNKVLYIPLITVTPTDRPGEVFNFKISGHKFARIKDYSAEDPREWDYDYVDFTAEVPQEISAFAATSVVDGDYVYFYPFYVYHKEKDIVLGNILARIPADRIDQPASGFEYFTKEGTWTKDLRPDNVKIVLDACASELSVRYHAAAGKWVAVYLSTQNKGDKLIYRTADQLEGPWSPPNVLIDSIPEVDSHSPLYDKNNFCYAGKEHIGFAGDKNIVATYVCNSFEDLEKQDSFIRRNLFLYRPVVREVEWR